MNFFVVKVMHFDTAIPPGISVNQVRFAAINGVYFSGLGKRRLDEPQRQEETPESRKKVRK